MYIAKVTGTVVSTRKDNNLVGKKILVVQPLDIKGKALGVAEVAVDSVGAGVGEIVLVSTGSSASKVFGADSPIDRTIVGIIDSLEASSEN
jgi:microcompartment protein CcmK/EutM